MTREYVDDNRTRITSYSITKVITYLDDDKARYKVSCLSMLKRKQGQFSFIHIPEFEYWLNGFELTIESDFIKGHQCVDIQQLYDDIIPHSWTFMDPHPSNFITCKKTRKTYAVDLDSFMYAPNICDRKRKWYTQWPRKPYPFVKFTPEGEFDWPRE